MTEKIKLIRYTLILTGITVILFIFSILYFDLWIAEFFNQSKFERIYYYSREITNIGYSIHYFLLALFGVIFTKVVYPNIEFFNKSYTAEKNERIYRWSVFTIKIMFLIGVGLNVIKFLVGRLRPHASNEFYNMNFDMFNTDSHWHSFPSGHSQVLFTAATIGFLIFPKLKYIFLASALIFSLTRITIHQHFLSDMIVGAYIGHVATLWLYYYWPHRTEKINV